MEESEKRRERLKAMRMEASQADVGNDVHASPGILSNPFNGTLTNQTVETDLCATTQRFDFYTDPMTAFSINRRINIPPDHFSSSRPRNPQMSPSPTQHLTPRFSPDSAYHAQIPQISPFSTNHLTPRGLSPFDSARLTNSQTCPELDQHFRPKFSPDHAYYEQLSLLSTNPQMITSPTPHLRTKFSPDQLSCNGQQYPQYRPSPQMSPFPMHTPNYGNISSPRPNYSRGTGRKGHGSRHSYVSADDRPDMFYNKSMVEDPWRYMKPVIWAEDFLAQSSSMLWLPKSLRAKKIRVLEPQRELGSQPSLAEYLAASLSEATNDEGI